MLTASHVRKILMQITMNDLAKEEIIDAIEDLLSRVLADEYDEGLIYLDTLTSLFYAYLKIPKDGDYG